jgi:cytoskeletal protein CcmA (bactofilin family)
MVFNRKSEPASPAKTTAVTAGTKPVQQHLAAQNQMPPMNGAPFTIGPGHNSGLLEESLIGSDLSVEGQSITIRCKGRLRVNGNIQADLHSRQLEVGREAIVTGSITAESVDVHGRVNGAILSNRVILHSSAEVDGDIAAEYLSIEQGASFDGRSRRVRDASEIQPQTEPAAASSLRRAANGYAEHLNGSADAGPLG